MAYILAGLLLWTAAHGFKRFLPGLRNALGPGGRGLVTVFIFVSIGLMVWGYKTADDIIFWTTPGWLMPINNVLMLIAVYLFAVGGAKTRLSLVMRHPMLNGMKVWGVAHILVNGDVASLALFGGLIAWSYFAVFLIDREEAWVLPPDSSIGKEIGVILISVVVYVGLLHAHAYLGPDPFWQGWPIGGS